MSWRRTTRVAAGKQASRSRLSGAKGKGERLGATVQTTVGGRRRRRRRGGEICIISVMLKMRVA